MVIHYLYIESNLRQRVLGNTNSVKLGRCFSFLNNWYGFKNGGDRKSDENLFNLKNFNEPINQKELAESYGIIKHTMNNYMCMSDMIPELEDLVDTGIVAYNCFVEMCRLLFDSSDDKFWLIVL